MGNEKREKETQANGTATPGTMTQVMSYKTGQQSVCVVLKHQLEEQEEESRKNKSTPTVACKELVCMHISTQSYGI